METYFLRLRQAEVQPPYDLWDKIEESLEAKNDAEVPESMAESLRDAEICPPSHIEDDLFKKLENSETTDDFRHFLQTAKTTQKIPCPEN